MVITKNITIKLKQSVPSLSLTILPHNNAQMSLKFQCLHFEFGIDVIITIHVL